jgi:hypothetical protein
LDEKDEKEKYFYFQKFDRNSIFFLSNKTSTTASVQKLCHVIWSKTIWLTNGATTLSINDTQHDGTQNNDSQHNDTRNNDT